MGELLVLKSSNIPQIMLPLQTVLELVEKSVSGIALGTAVNPPKIAVTPAEKSITIAMLARCGPADGLGIKSYTEFPTSNGRSRTGSTITLFDDTTGRALAFMDCQWITAARTAAVTALFAREAAVPSARKALIVGAGAQARETIPALVKVLPGLEEISIRAPRRDAVERLIAQQGRQLDGRVARFCLDLDTDARSADVIVGAGGPGAQSLIAHAMLKPGSTAILVGYGLASDVLQNADRVLATSEAQMFVTGKDLADARGQFPAVDAELPDILSLRKAARTGSDQIVFAYNSGLAVTDVAVANALYKVALDAGIGDLIADF